MSILYMSCTNVLLVLVLVLVLMFTCECAVLRLIDGGADVYGMCGAFWVWLSLVEVGKSTSLFVCCYGMMNKISAGSCRMAGW